MTSLVQDFLVNPVVRQARRFSTQRPSATTDAPGTETSACLDGQHQPEHVVVDSESEEHPSSDFEIDQMSSSSPSTASLQNVSMDSPDNARMADAVRALESMTERLSIPDQAPEVAVSPSPRTFKPGRSMLPEDDGMGVMRRRIRAIQAQHVTSSEKAHLMHKLLSEGHQRTQTSARSRSKPYPSSSSAGRRSSRTHDPSESYSTSHDAAAAPEAVDQSHLTDQDLEPTYAPVESHADEDVDSTGVAGNRPFGCEHYRRNIKMQCSTCNRWYTCRFCHNQAEDHELIRHQTRNMLCMFCGVAQKAGESCAACGALAARYYCAICKLWSDDPDKPCYHCHDCGICRIGEGLGKDFVHCKVRPIPLQETVLLRSGSC
ncbi:zf-CHY-domain-containing protein [Xylariaceae sp. FL0016]|nr:zf-CHY-domain-containing protein [Xylariaceae sp. FL0016]